MAEFELTEEQLAELMEAARPTPYLLGDGGRPLVASPQENANRAWAALSKEMGFDYMTVRPVPGKGQRFFTARETAHSQARERLGGTSEQGGDHA